MLGLPDYDLIADGLDKAHDEMLVRGKGDGRFENSRGEVCLVGALYAAAGATEIAIRASLPCVNDFWRGSARVLPDLLGTAIAIHNGVAAASIWVLSDDHDIDFTLDVLRDTAKAARNGEL